ncbi:MAG: xanthine dehydrogenase family protein molybdopterin-binding subunit [Acidimicrobiales bacterium]
MSILGNKVVRREDPRFLTGGGTYVENLKLERPAYLVYVRSILAHARVTNVDTAEAEAAPGVLGVFTGAQVTEALGLAPNVFPMFPAEMRRPYVAADVVRYVGQPMVAVLAETREAAVDAAELVLVDYEELPVVIDLEQSATDEVVLFPDHGTNVLNRMSSEHQADFADCEVVVSERIVNQRLTGAPIEPRAGAAWWTDDGRLVHWSACQGAHPTRDLLATVYGLEPAQVQVVVPDVGGGFGAKSRTYPEELALAWYARQLGRPVKWTETRSENVAAMPQGRGQIQYAKLGGTRDGKITAYQLDVFQDAGAYPIIGAILAGMTQRMLTGVYEIANCGFNGTAVVTNKVSTTAYRGAGRPEATVAIERMIDRFAAEIGMDPAEVRRINLVPRFTQPYTTGIGTQYDSGDYPAALEMVLDKAGYADLRAEQARRRAEGATEVLGIGLGAYVEITAGGPGGEFGSIEVLPGGRMRVTSGATPSGQGHDTTWAMLVSEYTGVAMDDIEVVHGDTDAVARGGLTVGSRSVQLAGSALVDAAGILIEKARNRAADQLEAALGDVVFDAEGGRFHVVGSPVPALGWAELAAEAPEPLIAGTDFSAPMPTFPSGAHLAVVLVDTETGRVRLDRLVAVDDAGTIINPLLAEGQVHGGLAQGVAQALYEQIVYDESGNLLTSNFMDYMIVSTTEMPSYEVHHIETPTWVNPLGAKGVGESGTIGSIPAVYNAVIDAVAHLGVRHLETPLTPERVWAALQPVG